MKGNTVRIAKAAPKYRIWGKDEVVYGPFELLTLVDWIRKGRVTLETWVFTDSRRGWLQAGNLEELKRVFLEPPPPKPAHEVKAIAAGVSEEILRRIKVLEGFSEQQCQSFLEYMQIITLEPMTYALREREVSEAMFLILEGELRASVRRRSKENILALLKAGDFFGEISLLDRGPRSADVIVNERSTLLKISASAFAKLRQEAPALAEPFLFALSKTIVGRLRQVNKRYQDSVLMLQALGPIAE